jgi:ATP-binding cassette subfamily C (CFTR/MRP) protein 2
MANSEALVNMKVLKLYAWETHFKNVIENLGRWSTNGYQ